MNGLLPTFVLLITVARPRIYNGFVTFHLNWNIRSANLAT